MEKTTPTEPFRRLKLTLAYDGRPFQGWQSQPGGASVQDHVESAIAETLGRPVRIHGSGRTDAGVHALAQIAHFDVPLGNRMSGDNWRDALNTRLPRTIRVMHCEEADEGFHARFSAVGKTYCYKIYNGPVMPPLHLGLAWHFVFPLNGKRLESAAALFEGTHDFLAFSANRGTSRRHDPDDDFEENTVRTLRPVRIERSNEHVIELYFQGDGFLYKMVRLLTGALVRCAAGRMEIPEIEALLDHGTRDAKRYCAPADGLYLVEVDYGGGRQP